MLYKYKPLQFIDTSLAISHFLLAIQRDREAMKDVRTHYGATDIS